MSSPKWFKQTPLNSSQRKFYIDCCLSRVFTCHQIWHWKVFSPGYPEFHFSPIESLSRNFKKQMKDLMGKYDQPGNVDKTAQVREKVEAVQGVMQDNVRRILDTVSWIFPACKFQHTNLEGLEEKTDSMSRQANQFLKQSVDLRRQMQMRNLWLKLCVGVTILTIFIWIVVKIAKPSSRWICANRHTFEDIALFAKTDLR